MNADLSVSEEKGILDVLERHRDKEYFEKLQKIKPDLDLMDYNVLKVATWRAFSNIVSEDGKIGFTEYGETYRNLVDGKNYKRTKNEYPCTQGNPITVIDQDLSRLRKISDED
ncbi:hypothetical protein D915_001679 [Fasciola hepatica]|uniref:Uncharacterized protein n=1 Tax=Fasciola hepatica TaxID=6192 RepID=A0A4E0S2F5_FASHE|nr:hypothetical protein D915_001679 [Fasciola hepatica]